MGEGEQDGMVVGKALRPIHCLTLLKADNQTQQTANNNNNKGQDRRTMTWWLKLLVALYTLYTLYTTYTPYIQVKLALYRHRGITS